MKKNPFEKFEGQPKEINKAEIFGALKQSYGGNPLMVKKTGKEIKEQINNVILPFLLEKKDSTKVAIDDFLSSAVVMPTHPCWMKLIMSEEEFPYKQYTWEEMNWNEKSFGQIFKGFGDVEVVEEESCEGASVPTPYYPQSKEESEARHKYNALVEDFRDIIMDIKTANVLVNSLKDEDEYWLSVDQLVSLKFDDKK
jgi:hypothetical protein